MWTDCPKFLLRETFNCTYGPCCLELKKKELNTVEIRPVLIHGMQDLLLAVVGGCKGSGMHPSKLWMQHPQKYCIFLAKLRYVCYLLSPNKLLWRRSSFQKSIRSCNRKGQGSAHTIRVVRSHICLKDVILWGCCRVTKIILHFNYPTMFCSPGRAINYIFLALSQTQLLLL